MAVKEYFFKELIQQAEDKSLVIPTFQRGFKWKIFDIRKLLESIMIDDPIGSGLIWYTDQDKLGWRPVKGIELNLDENGEDNSNDESYMTESSEEKVIEKMENREKIDFILDGQQRITSIIKIFPRNLVPKKDEIDSHLNGVRFFIDLKILGLPGAVLEKFPTDENAFYDYMENKYEDSELISDAVSSYTYKALKKEIKNINPDFSIRDDITEENIKTFIKEKFMLPLTYEILENKLIYFDKFIKRNAINKYAEYLEQANSIPEEQAREDAENVLINWNSWFSSKFQQHIVQKKLTCEIVRKEDPDGLSRMFESINSTGMRLTVFDLLVARMSSRQGLNENDKTFNLREHLIDNVFNNYYDYLKLFDDGKDLGGTATQQLPRIFGLTTDVYIKSSDIEGKLKKKEKSVKKSEILIIEPKYLIKNADKCCVGLRNGITFLMSQLGVSNDKYLPFKDAITLTGSVFNEDNQESGITNLFKAFYFLIIFTEELEQDTNSVTKRLFDGKDNISWERLINKAITKEEFFNKLNKFPEFDVLLELSNKNSTLYKAVLTFVLHQSNKDWKNNSLVPVIPSGYLKLEDHHIFSKDLLRNSIGIKPEGFETRKDLEKHRDSILNKILISQDANRDVEGKAPSIYLQEIDEKDLEYLCIPKDFKNAHQQPATKKKYLELLEMRYELIKKNWKNKISEYIKDYYN